MQYSYLDETNRSALKYNDTVEQTVNEICRPLFTNFGLTYFGYAHFFNDGTYLDLCTHKEWQRVYIENYAAGHIVRNHIKSIYENNLKCVLWDNTPGIPRDPVMSRFIEESCGLDIWHGFSMYRHHIDSLEAWHFATTREHYGIVNFYLNHIELLNRFIGYFHDKAACIVDACDLGKRIVLKDRGSLFINNDNELHVNIVNNFISQTDIKRFQIKAENHTIYLSRREIECMLHLAKHRTTKDIAKRLNLSHRTVESYLSNIKKKTNCHTKSQLVELFARNNVSL